MGGKHRLRLSDMMPNAWFYKLKDMNQPQRNNPTTKKTTKSPSPPQNNQNQKKQQQQQPPLVPNRASYYFPSNSPVHPKAFDTHFPTLDSPKISTTPHKPPRTRIPAIVMTSSSSLSLSSFRGSVSDSDSDSDQYSYCSTNNNAPLPPSSSDIVLDIVGSELELRPILTKPPIKKQQTETCTKPATKKASPAVRRVVRMRRASSPTSSAKKVRAVRKGPSGLSESFAVVKSSSDPKKDFRESMAEMIAENGLGSPKQLEDLLACYLSLNSNHYHHVIVEVFEDIWFQITANHY